MIILAVIAVVVVVFIAVVASQPNEFRVTRSAIIDAPPEVVFPHVNNLHAWQAWSPWAKKDPAAQAAYDGPEEGVGAGFGWDGNNQVGKGHMAIIESRPNDRVRFRLDFEKPFKGTNEAEFTFTPTAGATTVTWTMFGKANFFMKAFGLFVDCDKMCGRDFEDGLTNLKTVVAGVPQPA